MTTKKEAVRMLEYIKQELENATEYTEAPGSDSWGYSARSPDTCINVKLETWCIIDEVEALLSEEAKERAEIKDLEYMLNDCWWRLVSDAQEELQEYVKERWNADSYFLGRSSGWFCPVLNFTINDSYYIAGLDCADKYDREIIKQEYETIQAVYKQWNEIKDYVHEKKEELEAKLVDPATYVEMLGYV